MATDPPTGGCDHDDRGGIRQDRRLKDLARLCCGRSYVAPPLEGQRRGGLTVHGRNIIAAAFARSAYSLGTPQEGHESWLLRSISSGRM